jgi:glycosyltransferase involved in cell wall biosynthesis
MIIAYLTNEYGRASDTFIRGEVDQLRALGYTVHTFSPRRPGADEVVGEEVRRAQQTTEYLLDPELFYRNVARMFAAALGFSIRSPGRMLSTLRLALQTCTPGLRARIWQVAYLLEASLLARRMEIEGVQLLHNHMGTASAYVAMFASELTGIPYSLTIHGSHIFFEPKRWALGDKISRSAFTACISSFGKSQCMIFTPYERWDRLHVVRCGLDERFLDSPEAPLPEQNRLITVGRLTEEKGHPLLLEAIATLRARGYDLSLTIVGDGPMRGDLEAMIQRLGLGGCVTITGWRTSDEVRRELLASRGFVLPSYAEGIPVVLMEALMLRRPVVCTKVGGIPELVEHGKSGWLVSPGTPGALTEGIQKLLDASTKTLTRMGRQGAERVKELHNGSQEARKLAELFEQVVNGTGGPGPRT